MKKIFSRPKSIRNVKTHYCPGCGHGIVHRLICEVIDELDIQDKTIAVCPVGCAVVAYDYWDFDCCEAAHGRALAVATAMKRLRPENTIFTYQGDGDLAAIGIAETIHTANRGENLTCIFINNAVYGMTGGQMAPTTLINQKTATTPSGRDLKKEGPPLNILGLLATLASVKYLNRVTITSAKRIREARQAIKEAFTCQIENKGFAMVEVLSSCPTYWNKNPTDAMRWIDEHLVKEFPLGRIK
ncbi:MAG: thiamine pyrophosphate-dependent enzyme [Candidatus Omnitrophota bacterium]